MLIPLSLPLHIGDYTTDVPIYHTVLVPPGRNGAVRYQHYLRGNSPSLLQSVNFSLV